jgi:hypothetical protein
VGQIRLNPPLPPHPTRLHRPPFRTPTHLALRYLPCQADVCGLKGRYWAMSRQIKTNGGTSSNIPTEREREREKDIARERERDPTRITRKLANFNAGHIFCVSRHYFVWLLLCPAAAVLSRSVSYHMKFLPVLLLLPPSSGRCERGWYREPT